MWPPRPGPNACLQVGEAGLLAKYRAGGGARRASGCGRSRRGWGRSPRGLRRPLSSATLAVTAACMVLAAGFGVVGTVLGLWIRCHEGESRRGQTTSAFLFLGGLLLLTALIGYTVKSAWNNNVFFSWSYFSGWLALPFSILAGNLESGNRVEEATQKAPQLPFQETPGTSQGLPSTLPTPTDLAEAPLEPQNLSPRGPPGHRPQGPPSSPCPALPSPQASAFYWQT
ncbi:claudin domain-containing protein 2 isoform X1 [Saimiri boliviensis]|uniref:claudin domain-containing protein 2 isoform X1 n=1 Tax=Saimiri boliviensis TaxID=27679 RepID=UPI00193D01F0|nr:claudin domain-containing protein 2 isoform X1 [Saimiri boliviensis boliviensis]